MTADTENSDLVSRLVPFLIQRGYEPGERVPSERELAERFVVSRGQVREALSYLEALKFVERKAKSGIYMSAQRPSLEALALLTQFGLQLSREDIQQSVELRKIFEVSAIRLAAERALPENLAKLDDIMIATEQRIAAGEGIENEDIAFHLEIVRATQNDIFVRMVSVFYLMSTKRRAIYFSNPARCKLSLKEHEALLKALKARDVALCEQLMDRHLQGVDSYWRGLIQTLPERDTEAQPS